MGMPVGLAFNFTINGTPFVIPMAIEEPSVVAAVSSAAKTISTYQGFQAWAPERNMVVAQVQLLDIQDENMDVVFDRMKARADEIKIEANEYCTNMVLRGGGVQRVTFHRVRRHRERQSFKGQDLLVKHGVVASQSLPLRDEGSDCDPSLYLGKGKCSEWLVVHLHVDVGDAMGANCANTVAEGIAPFLSKLSGARIGVRILSNLNVDRIAKVCCRMMWTLYRSTLFIIFILVFFFKMLFRRRFVYHFRIWDTSLCRAKMLLSRCWRLTNGRIWTLTALLLTTRVL